MSRIVAGTILTAGLSRAAYGLRIPAASDVYGYIEGGLWINRLGGCVANKRKNLNCLTREVNIMKSFFVLPFLALVLTSFQANALCLYNTESYSGTVSPKSEITANGPFTITSAGGCAGASIDASISSTGAGRAPEIYIEREAAGTWRRETFNLGSNASYSGPHGTYRVRLNNQDAVPKSYSGTVRYGR